MSEITAKPRWFRFSLRTMFVVVTLLGIVLAALMFGGAIASAFSMLAMLLIAALAVVALVGREEQQTFAIGFVAVTVVYTAILAGVLAVNGTRAEFDPYEGVLPTSKVLLPVFQAIVRTTWVDIQTGEEVANYTFKKFGGNTAGVKEQPTRREFMAIAHLTWALLFGYVGGKFAVFLNRRTERAGRLEP